jgi:formate dehydrogenase major subunit
MTFHFPDQVATNELTVDAVDPLSGTSEFKASAVRIEPVGRPAATLREEETVPVPA